MKFEIPLCPPCILNKPAKHFSFLFFFFNEKNLQVPSEVMLVRRDCGSSRVPIRTLLMPFSAAASSGLSPFMFQAHSAPEVLFWDL